MMRVLLTRNVLHNMLFRQTIEEHLESLGLSADAEILEAPLLEQVAVIDSEESLQTFLQDKKIQEVIFISPSSVDFGVEKVFHQIKLERAFAVGKGTANLLKTKFARMSEQHLTLDSVKNSNEIEVVFPIHNTGSQGLLDLSEMKAVKNSHILIVTGSEGKPYLEKKLLERGAQVSRWECYQRQKPLVLSGQIEKILEQPLRYVFLHSPHAARHFMEEIPAACSMNSSVAIVGAKSIAEELQKHGWQGSIELSDSPMPKDMLKVFKQQLT